MLHKVLATVLHIKEKEWKNRMGKKTGFYPDQSCLLFIAFFSLMLPSSLSLLGYIHIISDSVCAGTKTIPDRAFVHS